MADPTMQSVAQARRYVRDMLQFGQRDNRVLFALSEREAQLFRGVLEETGLRGRVRVVDTSVAGYDVNEPVRG